MLDLLIVIENYCNFYLEGGKLKDCEYWTRLKNDIEELLTIIQDSAIPSETKQMMLDLIYHKFK